MIRNKDVWANPYRDNVRQNGIRRYDQHGSDLSDLSDGLDAARGIGNALVLGAALWAVVGLAVALWKGWLL